jgi:hypothetical protein
MKKRQAPVGSVSSNNRSRLTNGSQLLVNVDGRSAWARRFRDVISLHTNERGGAGEISAAEAAVIRSAACLSVELELLEARMAAMGGADAETLDLYSRVAGSQRRLFEAIGFQRRPRDVTPSLAHYLAEPK